MSWDGISASSISITPPTSGCHILKIDGYSQTKLLRGCTAATSCEFEVAGQIWCIKYYPNGSIPQAPDHISFLIKLARRLATNTIIRAKIRLSLLPSNGGAPYCRGYVTVLDGPGAVNAGGFSRFISREAFEKSEYLVDDCFVLRCDIEVEKASLSKTDSGIGVLV
ncbi:hypothetical protein ACP70R_003235 [Stipagrostis hirtigluma subsp. patula]